MQVIPLEELGRPRVDVIVNCSGVFRDLFVNQMLLLDRAVKMAAELDEPAEMNFVRKHAIEQVWEVLLHSSALLHSPFVHIFSTVETGCIAVVHVYGFPRNLRPVKGSLT